MADPVAVVVPRETVNDDSVKLLAIHVKDGDWVIENQTVAEVETSKAVLELEAPCAGFIRIMAKVGTEVAIGLPICFIGETADFVLAGTPASSNGSTAAISEKPPAEKHAPVAKASISAAVTVPAGDLSAATRFTPLAKSMAEDAGLTLEDFRGIRIVRSADVKAYLAGAPLPQLSPAIAPAAPEPSHALRTTQVSAPVPATGVEMLWEELPRRKQVEIKQIAAGMANILPSSVTVCTQTRGLRAAVDQAGIPGLSASAVIVYEAARLLKKYPLLNALYSGDRAGYYQEVNIGWAVDDGTGLMVPVLRNADKKSMLEIASESQSLLEKYLMKKLGVQDFVGATFTISDLSSAGVLHFSPLVSQGQCAILGIGAEFFLPGSDQGLFNLTLAFDHQLADGRIASSFLQDLSNRLAAYEQLLLPAASEPEVDLKYCLSCNRDVASILKLKAYLLKSEVPEGYVCSLCLGGH